MAPYRDGSGDRRPPNDVRDHRDRCTSDGYGDPVYLRPLLCLEGPGRLVCPMASPVPTHPLVPIAHTMTNLQFSQIIATIWLVGLLVLDKNRAYLKLGTYIFALACLFNFLVLLIS